jgi:myo-inositol-1(or 4)-monophosphatase
MTVDFLKELLLSSGEILRNGFGQIGKIDTKHDQSNIVTDFDFKSEEHLRKTIAKKYPAHNILGEEHGFEDNEGEYTWIIDPLDGTSNFAAQIPWFGVLIALLKDNQPILAGAYLPISDELYYATKGGGAFKNDKLIRASDESDLINILCTYSLDFSEEPSKTEHEVQVIKRLVQNCRNLRSTNSLVDFCLLSEGKTGAAMNQTMKIWDIAAPQLIIEEAGGKVTDIKGQNIMYKSSASSATTNYTAVAANQQIHEKIMELLHNSTSSI